MLVCIYILVIDKNDFLQELQWSEALQTLADETLIECVYCMSPYVCFCFVLCMCGCARVCVCLCVCCVKAWSLCSLTADITAPAQQ